MTIRIAIILSIIFICENTSLLAQELKQEQVNLEEFKPVFNAIGKHEVESGEELVISLKAKNKKETDLTYSFSWDFGGEIDQNKKEFKWVPNDNIVGIYPIIFSATDPVTKQITNQPAIIEVKEKQYSPILKATHGRRSRNGFILLNESEEFAMLLEAKDKNKNENLTINYSIEGEPGKKLENARFEVNGRRATFIWIPSDKQAKKRSFTLAFTTTDHIGLKDTKRFSFLINDIQHPPVFQNKNLDYFISEGKPLSFTMKATDLDNDQLYYDVKSEDVKFNDYKFNRQTGKFQWTPGFNYAIQDHEFELVFSVNDGNTTVYDTVHVVVDAKNYPPEIEPIAEKFINENMPLNVKLRVKDLNGNESLQIEAIADFEGFEFDEEQRTFTWVPPFDFVNGVDKKTVLVKFTASDGLAESSQRMRVTVYDREDPQKLLNNYDAVMKLSQKMIAQLSEMNADLAQRVKRKKFWNTFFDVSTVTIGTFTSISSSSLVKEGFRQTAAPIGSAMTTLIGLYAILDKSKDKLSELNWKMVTLQTSLDRTTGKMVRKYSENPIAQVTENPEFTKDLNDFEKTITECEIEKDKLLIEFAKLNGK